MEQNRLVKMIVSQSADDNISGKSTNHFKCLNEIVIEIGDKKLRLRKFIKPILAHSEIHLECCAKF